ncbi:InlB B-repeat-containing protein, partial [Klebsiella pneumoniae]
MKINVTVDPMGGGRVTGNGTYNYGEQVTLSITPAEFFTFINW